MKEAEQAIRWAQSRHIWDVGRQQISEAARAFRGPKSVVCAECGGEIGAYESRRYGSGGAVHVWDHSGIAKLATCLTRLNEDKYPHFYTDG